MSNSSQSLPLALRKSLVELQTPESNSYKGQNGKLLIIGGSELFHAASKWSLDVASKFVDMVFYASVPENNALVKEAKGNFWNGIVISRDEISQYIGEADAVLIGPGMTRSEETKHLTESLLQTHPHKKWVIDAGALQMANPHLFSAQTILTPHHKELEIMWNNFLLSEVKKDQNRSIIDFKNITAQELQNISRTLGGATIVLKGPTDLVVSPTLTESIQGGNAGMTKGGTGDVLAGLIAALYCTQSAQTAALVGSYCNKKAGDELFAQVGPFFNASDLVTKIPAVVWEAHRRERSAQ